MSTSSAQISTKYLVATSIANKQNAKIKKMTKEKCKDIRYIETISSTYLITLLFVSISPSSSSASISFFDFKHFYFHCEPSTYVNKMHCIKTEKNKKKTIQK